MNSELVKILPTISKPTRYLGDEVNSVKKDPGSPGQIRFALAFPDIYDVGMSHLGSRILYHILNSRDDVWAERVYAPWIDMEAKMREKGIQLFSLESTSPLKDFDIIGFSLQYEMSYTNVLNMLDLAQIPLLSADRDSSYPLIIAGGPCAFNPEPISDFIDLFAIGDGEEVVLEIVDCYKSFRDAGRSASSFADKKQPLGSAVPTYAGISSSFWNRKQLLSKMGEIEGVYVPSLTPVEEETDGTLVVSNSVTVNKRVVTDLDNAPYPVNYLVPFMRPIHDRAIIEVMRGCSRGCRFCQAGMIYRPVRERSPAVVEDLAERVIHETGYEEISLSSLSTCDHSSICEILQQLVESQGKKHLSISLPSLRTDTFSVELARSLGSTGKTGLTFAPEVATERMQKVTNKNITRSDVLSTVERAFSTGWDSLKLYFMIGLPTETEEDVLQIADFTREALQVALRVNRRASLNVSVSTFVPKAHTPFQWDRQLSMGEIEQKQKLLLDRIGRNRRVKVSFHSARVSYLEGVFARGDRKLGVVLQAAHALGCKFDGWTEVFNFDAWKQAFAQSGVDPEAYHRERKRGQAMPWDHINTYVTKEFLQAERGRAYRAESTPDCRGGKCTGCGICDGERREMRLASTPVRRSSCDAKPKHKDSRSTKSSIHNPSPNTIGGTSLSRRSAVRIRIQFAKREAVKFISHLDMLNTFTRAFRRAGIPLAYTHGFNPHPKIRFGSVLPVGTTSEVEYADVDFETDMEPEDFVLRSNDQLPRGLEILKARKIPANEQALMAQINLASYIVRVSGIVSDPCSKIPSILSKDHIWIERSYRNKKSARRSRRKSGTSSVRRDSQSTNRFVDIKPRIRKVKVLNYIDGILDLEMVLGDGKDGVLRPEEVVRLIQGESVEDSEWERILSSIEIRKIGSFIEHQGQVFTPMDLTDERTDGVPAFTVERGCQPVTPNEQACSQADQMQGDNNAKGNHCK